MSEQFIEFMDEAYSTINLASCEFCEYEFGFNVSSCYFSRKIDDMFVYKCRTCNVIILESWRQGGSPYCKFETFREYLLKAVNPSEILEEYLNYYDVDYRPHTINELLKDLENFRPFNEMQEYELYKLTPSFYV